MIIRRMHIDAVKIFLYVFLALSMYEAPKVSAHGTDHTHECITCSASKQHPRPRYYIGASPK